jgi:hypothetical protein
MSFRPTGTIDTSPTALALGLWVSSYDKRMRAVSTPDTGFRRTYSTQNICGIH